jgi:uncharacterized protein YciI
MSTWLYHIAPARPGMPDAPTPEEAELVGAHFAYLTAKHREGVVSWVARTETAPHLGLAVFTAPDEAAARALLAADPAVAAGVFVGRVQPLKVVYP